MTLLNALLVLCAIGCLFAVVTVIVVVLDKPKPQRIMLPVPEFGPNDRLFIKTSDHLSAEQADHLIKILKGDGPIILSSGFEVAAIQHMDDPDD